MLLFIRASALVILASACAACANTARFVLANDAKEAIDSATVEVDGAIVELGQIQPGSRATGTLSIESDADYHIVVRFQSGRMLERRLGYVTSGLDFNAEFSVLETDIVLKKSEALSKY